jgi:DNA end-binding protein Ku
LVAVPVQAYAAVRTTTATPFHLLHANCGQRIHYQKCCPQHGPVDAAAIVRGVPCAPDQHVVIEPEELDQLRPARDKALVLEHFLPVHHVDPTFYAGRSLYLLPDGVAAQHPYGVVAAALQQAGQAALGRVVLATQRHLVLVRPVGRLLVLDVLHYPAQVRAAAAWQAELRACTATAQELQLAGQLVQAASGPVDWTQYRDTTAEELAALVEAKLANRPLAAARHEPAAVLQLLDALKQSVAQAAGPSRMASAAPRKARTSRRTLG